MCEKFLNPYHFIPLQNGKNKYKEDSEQEKYTGVLTYTVTTKTPLMIPGTILKYKNEEKKEHPYRRFFTYEDNVTDKSLKSEYEPAIPGSEIRGTIRSIYETLTNSCLSMTDAEKLITRRINDKFEPGLIQRTDKNEEVSYKLFKATRKQVDYSIVDQHNPKLEEGDLCKGTINQTKFYINETGTTKGYLLKGEKPRKPVGRKYKKHYSIFIKEENDFFDLSAQDIRELKHIIEVYDDPKLNTQLNNSEDHWYKEYLKKLDQFLSGTINHPFPVYYSIVQSEKRPESKIYLSPACITKEIYENRAVNLIKGYEPCKKKKENCPACKLFGMAGENNEESLAGKLRFTDLHPVPDNGSETKSYYYHGKNPNDSMVTLQELSNPKPSTAEFYLKKPENIDGTVLSWNYDYCVCQDTNGDIQFVMESDGYKAQLMGRKYYWHNLNPDFSTDEKTKRNQTVQLVDSEITFKGDIYFENISWIELRRLAWICNISSFLENHGYKIGGGKPLGLGSVEMRVSEISRRNIFISEQDGKIKYDGKNKDDLKLSKLFEGLTEDQYYSQGCMFHQDVYKQFDLLTTFLNGDESPADKKDILISYPISFKTEEYLQEKNRAEGYQWFVNNQVDRSTGNRKKFVERKSMRFDQHLKELSDIPTAMLKSTVAETSAKVSSMQNTGKTKKHIIDSKIEPLNFTIMEQFKNETMQKSVSSLNGEYNAKITSIDKKTKRYEIHFTLDDGTTGEIYVKKTQYGGCKNGSEIKVIYQDGKPTYMKMK